MDVAKDDYDSFPEKEGSAGISSWMVIMTIAKPNTYSLQTGLWKTFKNVAIVWFPMIVAYLGNIQAITENPYMGIALGAILYFIKNAYYNLFKNG